MIKPRIEILPNKKLVGKSIKMSLANNKTVELWQSFMPKRKSINNTVGSNLYSMQIYNDSLNFKNFNPNTEFEKWAAIEVVGFDTIPNDMKTYTLKGGLYAVFIHKGPASDFQKTFQYIFSQWLPLSDYKLDNRAHFELLGEKYKNNDPNSEEEVWIPIRPKKQK